MELLPSTFIALLTIGTMTVIGLRRGLWLFFAMMPLGAAAAFNMPAVGNASFGIRELAVIAVFSMVFFRTGGLDSMLGSFRPGQPGAIALLLFGYCVISAMWVPAVFNGATEVFTISRSDNVNGIRSIPLRPTTGNLTQLFALTISMMAYLAFATFARIAPDARGIDKAMAVATAVNLGLGLLDLLSAAAGVPEVLDPIRTANYSILSEARMLGLKRMIGGFPEASSYASFTMGLFGYWLYRSLSEPKSRMALAMVLIALFCVIRSTSSAGYVALVVFIGVFTLYSGATRMRAVLPKAVVMTAIIGALLLWHSMLLVYAAYELVEPVSAFLDQTVFNKLGSESGVERMSWNAQAFRNFTDTWLIGAGLGSSRASNWLLSSLGSIGLPGTALYVLFLINVFRMRPRASGGDDGMIVGALKWACAASLVTEILIASTPNLGVFFLALAGLATGLSRSSHADTASCPMSRPGRLA